MVHAPEQVAPGVYRVDAIGLSNAISVLLIADSDGWVLVDTGVRGSALRIQEALASLGAGPRRIEAHLPYSPSWRSYRRITERKVVGN
jgi:glyoxylase-like metal-dependent hydrolase (beta-lactamase superfamily II)